MLIDYELGAIVTVVLLVYLTYALLRPASMTLLGWTQIVLYCAIVLALMKPFGGHMTRVFSGERTLSFTNPRAGRGCALSDCWHRCFGGFFNANAAHPFENPTALANFVQMISIFAIGAALTNVFGRMVRNERQGWAILTVLGVLFITGVFVAYWAEARGNDAFTAMGLRGGKMEGKEVRFGIIASALFAVITTAASCGAVNAMHDSFTALGGMVPLINMQLGEIIVGGVGAGMYGMLLFVIISVFVAGLMVGRTPEYVGKKIDNEAAITGESAPGIREAGGDRSAVTGGTQVHSDWIRVRITAAPGSTFLDRMITLVEGAERQRTPNEIALNILLAGLTIIFVFSTATIPSYVAYAGGTASVVILVALFITLIPTTIGACFRPSALPAWTGSCALTCWPRPGERLRRRATLTPCSSTRPERLRLVIDRPPNSGHCAASANRSWRMPRTTAAISRSSAAVALRPAVSRDVVREVQAVAERIAKSGSTPLAVTRDDRLLGIVHLKDIVKGGIRERFAELRRMGIHTIMITGDNPTTAAAIAAEAGVDDFLAQATAEHKLKLIRDEQAKGKLVAMCGDGTNDAPALTQADVGVAMNTGTQAAREAGNMVNLDSNPTKLIEVVEIGKQPLMTRGVLTTFSIANDVAKYFAIIPAMFLAFYPQLKAPNIMGLATPQSAILSAIIFNALIIIALIPLALKGVAFRPIGAGPLLRRNLLIYGLGGIVISFVGIKAIDLVVTALHLA